MKNIFTIVFLFTCFLFPNLVFAQAHNWTKTNPGGGGAFSTIGAGPTGIIIAGSDLSGAYRSANGGVSWSVIGANEGLTNTHVSGIGFHPSNGNILFIGTEDGIYRSTDGGNTVTKTDMAEGYVTDIEFCRDDPSFGYATYHPEYDTTLGVIYQTINNGINWTKVSNNSLPNNLRILKIEVHPTNKNIVYLKSGDGRFKCSEARLYKSTDGGVNWTNIFPMLSEAIPDILDFAIDKDNPSTVYCTTMNSSCDNQYFWDGMAGSFFVSNTGGNPNDWTLKGDHTGVIWPKMGASGTVRLIDPREPWPWNTNDQTAGTWKTTDNGDTWTHTIVDGWDTGFQNFGDVGANLYHSYSPSFNGICKTLGADLSQDKIYWTNNQWVFSSTDEGVNFTNEYTTAVGSDWASRGFDNVTMTDLSICESNPDVAFLGYHDIGLWGTTDGGASWHSCNEPNNPELTGDWEGYGGNTFTVLVDPDDPNLVWASMQPSWGEFSYLMRNTQNGDKDEWVKTSGLIVNLDTPSIILGLSIDLNSTVGSRTLFVTSDGDVFKSTDDGVSWQKKFSNGGIRFTMVHPVNGNIIYAGGETGLFKTIDGGDNWVSSGVAAMQGNTQKPFTPRDWSGVSKIRINPQGDVFVSVFGAGKGLWISRDNGNTWIKKVTDDFMRSVAIVPNNSLIYTASSSAFTAGGYTPDSRGVQFSTDGGDIWADANQGMAFPFAVCMETIDEDNPTIWVGSPGTGFQKAIIPAQILPVTIINPFTAQVQNQKVRLSWQTSEEIQNAGFIIERSKDGIEWQLLANVSPNSLKVYSVIDSNPFFGISYYRLTQKDLDETKEHIGTVSIVVTKKGSLRVHPNPTSDILNITFTNAITPFSVHLNLHDSFGRLLLSQKGLNLDLTDFAKGTYYVTIQSLGQVWHERVIRW